MRNVLSLAPVNISEGAVAAFGLAMVGSLLAVPFDRRYSMNARFHLAVAVLTMLLVTGLILASPFHLRADLPDLIAEEPDDVESGGAQAERAEAEVGAGVGESWLYQNSDGSFWVPDIPNGDVTAIFRWWDGTAFKMELKVAGLVRVCGHLGWQYMSAQGQFGIFFGVEPFARRVNGRMVYPLYYYCPNCERFHRWRTPSWTYRVSAAGEAGAAQAHSR